MATPDEVNAQPVEHVDEDGRVIEVVTRAEMRARGLRHRAVYVVVHDSAGSVVVHRRADWKDVHPGRWDVAFGGVVDAGETWEAAARRELQEEAGITTELTEVAAGAWTGDGASLVGRVFAGVHDGPYPCPDGEVVEVRTVPLADLAGFLAAHPHCPDSVELAADHLGLR